MPNSDQIQKDINPILHTDDYTGIVFPKSDLLLGSARPVSDYTEANNPTITSQSMYESLNNVPKVEAPIEATLTMKLGNVIYPTTYDPSSIPTPRNEIVKEVVSESSSDFKKDESKEIKKSNVYSEILENAKHLAYVAPLAKSNEVIISEKVSLGTTSTENIEVKPEEKIPDFIAEKGGNIDYVLNNNVLDEKVSNDIPLNTNIENKPEEKIPDFTEEKGENIDYVLKNSLLDEKVSLGTTLTENIEAKSEEKIPDFIEESQVEKMVENFDYPLVAATYEKTNEFGNIPNISSTKSSYTGYKSYSSITGSSNQTSNQNFNPTVGDYSNIIPNSIQKTNQTVTSKPTSRVIPHPNSIGSFSENQNEAVFSQEVKRIVKNTQSGMTKSALLTTASLLMLTGGIGLVAISPIKCRVDRWINSGTKWQIWEECWYGYDKIVTPETMRDVLLLQPQGGSYTYASQKGNFPDGKQIDFSNYTDETNVTGVSVSDGKVLFNDDTKSITVGNLKRFLEQRQTLLVKGQTLTPPDSTVILPTAPKYASLTITGNTVLGNETSVNDIVGTTNFKGSLNTPGLTVVQGNTNITNLTTTGNTSLNGLTNSGSAVISGSTSTSSLNVGGATNTASLGVLGTTTTGGLSVGGASILSSITNNGQLNQNGNLSVTGGTNLGSLNVGGAVSLSSTAAGSLAWNAISNNISSSIAPTESFEFAGGSNIYTSLVPGSRKLTIGTVSNPSFNTVVIGGNTTIGGSLGIGGSSTFSGLVNNGTLTQNGRINSTGGINTDDLFIYGITNANVLNVLGPTNTAGINNNGSLSTNGLTNNGGLNQNGNVTINGSGTSSTTIGGAVDFTGSLVLPSSTAENGTQIVSGKLRLGGNLVQPTQIGTSQVNNLAITGLVTGSASDNVLVQDANGVVKNISPVNLVNGASTNLIELSKTGGLVSTVNTKISTQAIGEGALDDVLGFDSTGKASYQSFKTVLGGKTSVLLDSGAMGSGTNSLFAKVNGVKSDPVSIINTNVLSFNTSKEFISTVNGVSSAPIALLDPTQADNGLSLSNSGIISNIQLGGSLTKATTIGTSSNNTLTIAGLLTTTDPEVLVVDTAGKIGKKTLPILNANNGILVAGSGTNAIAQLGGNLNKATTIGTSATNTLTLDGLQVTNDTDVVVVDTNGRLARKTLPVLNANNGLSINGTGTSAIAQLGGSLSKATIIGTSPTNTLTIDSGSITGTKALEIKGDLKVTGVIDPIELQFSGNPISGSGYAIRTLAGSTAPIYLTTVTNQSNAFSVRKSDNITSVLSVDTLGEKVGIGTVLPTSTLSVNGTADKIGGGSWGSFSDQRLKKNISGYSSGLADILAMKPVVYSYNGKELYAPDDGKSYVGVLAQDIEKTGLGKYTVSQNGDGYLKYDSSAVMYSLVNATKELDNKIISLEKVSKGAIGLGGDIANSLTLENTLNVNGVAKFLASSEFQDIVVQGKAEFKDQIIVSANTAKVEMVKRGQTVVNIKFAKSYKNKPLVVLTPTDLLEGSYAVKNVTLEGYDIVLDRPQNIDITFNTITLGR
jgi:Chaperone of endosialidase